MFEPLVNLNRGSATILFSPSEPGLFGHQMIEYRALNDPNRT